MELTAEGWFPWQGSLSCFPQQGFHLRLQEILDYVWTRWFHYNCPHVKQKNLFVPPTRMVCVCVLKNTQQIFHAFSSVSAKYGKRHPNAIQLSLYFSKRKIVPVWTWPLWQINEMVHFKENLLGWEHISLWVLGGLMKATARTLFPYPSMLLLKDVFQHCECHSYYVTRWQILFNEPQHIKGKNNIFSPWEGLKGPSSCRCQLILFCQEGFNLEMGSKSRILTKKEVEMK